MKFKKLILFLLLTTFLLMPAVQITAQNSTQCTVHFIGVGQADCILVKTSSASILIDSGNREDSSKIIKYLKSQSVKAIDLVIGTHPHEDHIGGLSDIMKAFAIKKIMMPKITSNTDTFEKLLTTIKNIGQKISTPRVGEKISYGNVSLTILAPNSDKYEDVNNYSIVAKLQNGKNSFLFTGDAEDVSEKEILEAQNVTGILKSNVLKVGHHGSANSSTAAFLEAVKPEFAVISVGKDNDYGHPAQVTIDRLKKQGIKTYRTDESGTIVVTSDGDKLSFNKGIVNTSKTSPNTISKKNDTSNRKVYFTPKGKSYHLSKSCRTLARSKTILQGTLSEAIKEGHGDPCDVCVK